MDHISWIDVLFHFRLGVKVHLMNWVKVANNPAATCPNKFTQCRYCVNEYEQRFVHRHCCRLLVAVAVVIVVVVQNGWFHCEKQDKVFTCYRRFLLLSIHSHWWQPRRTQTLVHNSIVMLCCYSLPQPSRNYSIKQMILYFSIVSWKISRRNTHAHTSTRYSEKLFPFCV